MRILLIRKGGLHWMRSYYDSKSRTVVVYDSGKSSRGLFFVLSHELGHHNFQMKLERMPLWRRILARLMNEHELEACKQEGKPVEITEW